MVHPLIKCITSVPVHTGGKKVQWMWEIFHCQLWPSVSSEIHSGERLYEERECRKSFLDKSSLFDQQKVHVGERALWVQWMSLAEFGVVTVWEDTSAVIRQQIRLFLGGIWGPERVCLLTYISQQWTGIWDSVSVCLLQDRGSLVTVTLFPFHPSFGNSREDLVHPLSLPPLLESPAHTLHSMLNDHYYPLGRSVDSFPVNDPIIDLVMLFPPPLCHSSALDLGQPRVKQTWMILCDIT